MNDTIVIPERKEAQSKRPYRLLLWLTEKDGIRFLRLMKAREESYKVALIRNLIREECERLDAREALTAVATPPQVT